MYKSIIWELHKFTISISYKIAKQVQNFNNDIKYWIITLMFW